MNHLKMLVLILLASVSLSGCKNDAPANVTGKVTLDEQPLPNVEVTFYPADNSRSSVGVTDEKGEYSLRFTPSAVGAVVGEHKVVIAKGSSDDAARPEPIPARYNKNTELKATLKAGKQTVDFQLTTK